MAKKIIACGLIFVTALSVFALTGCGRISYRTKLTAEEHAANITRRTEEKYAEELADGSITSFTVEIIWSFKEKPEYFMVEFEGSFFGWDGESDYTGYGHTMGYIKTGDIYYQSDSGYPVHSKSIFKCNGLEDKKKYKGYATVGVEENGQIICVSSGRSPGNSYYYAVGEVIPKKDYSYLASHGYRLSSVPY